MARLKISGAAALNGEYEIVDSDDFTQGEWHEIKVHTGLRFGEFAEAWEARDLDVLAAVAWVAMTRTGKDTRLVWEELRSLKPAEMLELADETEDDAGPPVEAERASESEPENENDSPSSLGTTPESLESPEPGLNDIGTSLLVTGATSGHAISAG